MDKYIGTKLLEAIQMNENDFLSDIKNIPDEELKNREDREGYLVKYENGYESWSPKEIFEKAYNKLNGDCIEISSDLITIDNTYISADENTFNAPHNYLISSSKNHNLLCAIHFQEGALKENELNGVFMEDLIAICINRLENFQISEFKCNENKQALIKLQESLMWLRKRTNNRTKRNVLGTYSK